MSSQACSLNFVKTDKAFIPHQPHDEIEGILLQAACPSQEPKAPWEAVDELLVISYRSLWSDGYFEAPLKLLNLEGVTSKLESGVSVVMMPSYGWFQNQWWDGPTLLAQKEGGVSIGSGGSLRLTMPFSGTITGMHIGDQNVLRSLVCGMKSWASQWQGEQVRYLVGSSWRDGFLLYLLRRAFVDLPFMVTISDSSSSWMRPLCKNLGISTRGKMGKERCLSRCYGLLPFDCRQDILPMVNPDVGVFPPDYLALLKL